MAAEFVATGSLISQRDGTHLSLAGGFDAGEFTRQGHV